MSPPGRAAPILDGNRINFGLKTGGGASMILDVGQSGYEVIPLMPSPDLCRLWASRRSDIQSLMSERRDTLDSRSEE